MSNKSTIIVMPVKRFKRVLSSLITAALMVANLNMVVASAEDEQKGMLKLTAGVDYSSGDYGQTDDTQMLYLPFTLKYESLPWGLQLTVPWLSIAGSGTVVGGIDGGIVIGGHGAIGGHGKRQRQTTESGLGDVVAGVSFALDTLWGFGPLVDLTAKTKFATADETRGLGTGENDYSLQVDIANSYGRFTPFGTLGYKFMGDPPDFDLNDVLFASAGVDYWFHPALSGGVSFDFRESSSLASTDAEELLTYLNWKFTDRWSVNGYGVLGLSDGSPDSAIGVQLTYYQ